MGTSVSDTFADFSASAGMPAEDFMGTIEIPGQGICATFTSQEAANNIFYHDCTLEDQVWAFEHLTPLPIGPALETFHLPRFWAAPIPREFIIATEDHSHSVALDNEFMRRLGLMMALSIVSSHSPFISRPADLAKLLDRCARGTLA